MPVPPKTNITHYRGDSMVLQVVLWLDSGHTEPADLSEATVRAQVRATYDSTEAAADFDVEVVGNQITANLPPKESRDLPRNGVWDLEVDWFSDDTSVQTVAGGAWVTSPDVTRNGVVA
jgi:hypothetical protein